MRAAELVLAFPEPITFNVVSLREYLPLGQRVDRFAIEIEVGNAWREWCCKVAIGPRRLIRGQACATRRVRFRVVESPVCPAISEWGLFHDAEWAEPGGAGDV